MTIALVTTVRNERASLRTNLLYHRRLGVTRAFVFDDGSTDGTAETLADLAFVEVLGPARGSEFGGRPGLAAAAERCAHDYASRQILNAQRALDLAREQGCDWLLHIDADELLVAEGSSGAAGSLEALLGDVKEAEAVAFRPLEVVQTHAEPRNAFGELTLFKRRSPRLRRRVPDPYSGALLPIADFFGHTAGKWAVRVPAAAYPASVHAFRGAGGRALAVARRGALLHYYSNGVSDFVRKHRALPSFDRYASGAPVEAHKIVWRRMAQDPAWTEARLRDYYERHIVYPPAEIRRLRATRRFGFWPVEPAIVEVTAVRDALREMGLLDTPGADGG